MNIIQRHYLAHELTAAMYGIKWPVGAQEPDYIATMVINLPGLIKDALNKILPGRQFAVGNAFIHQKPLAHFTQRPCPVSPELGDMLVVCREKRASGVVYNAILLQAKRVQNILHTEINKKDYHQFILYSEWPEFKYSRADALNGQVRNIFPKTITQGAQYLLINKLSPNEMFTATVDNPLNGSKLFSRTLATIMSFDGGRTFDAVNMQDDWSQMIVDLLRISMNSVFNRRVYAGIEDEDRWNGEAAFEAILNAGSQDRPIEWVNISEEQVQSSERFGVICIDLGVNPNRIKVDKSKKEDKTD